MVDPVENDRWGEPLSASELFNAHSFGTRTSTRDGVLWMALGGELDVFSAPKLREAVDVAVPLGSESLVLDLRGLSFIDSSGLAVILGIHERMSSSEEGELRIVIAARCP